MKARNIIRPCKSDFLNVYGFKYYEDDYGEFEKENLVASYDRVSDELYITLPENFLITILTTSEKIGLIPKCMLSITSEEDIEEEDDVDIFSDAYIVLIPISWLNKFYCSVKNNRVMSPEISSIQTYTEDKFLDYMDIVRKYCEENYDA